MTEPTEDATNPLRVFSSDSGVGFCYDVDRQLFGRDGTHGPLLVCWDTNVLIDVQTYGTKLFNDEPLMAGDPTYEDELYALGALIDLWLIRDIRFLILPRGESDHRGPETEKSRQRSRSIAALADALTFQLQDWGSDQWRFRPSSSPDVSPTLDVFPAGADRELIAEAMRYGLDVFVTQDKGVLRARSAVDRPLIMRPTELIARLQDLGVDHLFGGRLDHHGCPYEDSLPAPDMGRWGPLFAALDGSY